MAGESQRTKPIRSISRRKVSHDPCSILIVDDEPYILATLGDLLSGEFDVIAADSPRQARQVFEQRSVDIVLSDQRMPGESGVQLLSWVAENYPKTVRMLMTGYAELEDAVEAINTAGIFSYIFKPWDSHHLLETLRRAEHTFRLERENERLLAELKRINQELELRVKERTKQLELANRELEQKTRMLERLALTDPLTNLPNRRAMDRLVERELRRRQRYSGPLTIGLLDIDHFKRINSRYLLPGGDKVLIDFTRCVANSLRTVDILGRVGGEEFLVLAPETDANGARVLAERIRKTVETTPFEYKEHTIRITVSGGFAVAEDDAIVSFDQMRDIAAAALAEAKNSGRNRCVVSTVSTESVERAC